MGWEHGQPIVVRSMWKGHLRAAWPELVLEDTPSALTMYIPKGITFRVEKTAEGKHARIPVGDRVLGHELWTRPTLLVTFPGRAYSFLAPWDEQHNGFLFWYLNLQTPITKTAHGFDFDDMFLDIVMSLDLTEWGWKDEDELREAEQLGLVTSEDVVRIQASGLKALGAARSLVPSLSAKWEAWRPDPSWPLPVLPPNLVVSG